MAVLKEPPENKFAFVVVASRRARQLQTGAPPLTNTRYTKPTSIAQEELVHGLLEFEMPERPDEAQEKEGKRHKG